VTVPEAARPFVGRHAAAIAALAQTSPPGFSDRAPSPTASVIQAAGFAIAVELDQPELLGDEIRRLEKALGKLEKDLGFVARKLENPQFLERAKAPVVEAERSRYASLAKEVEQARARLARLRAASGSER
jgi:valyl-tRNA synthetase